MIWQKIKDEFGYLVSTFRSNETIIWARIQSVVGAVWAVVSVTDLTQFHLNATYVAYWMVFNGVVTELIRRHREDWKT